MRKAIAYTLIVFNILLAQIIKADHIAGADLSYTCLGNNKYQINLNLYADCLGYDAINNGISSQQTVYISSACFGSTTTTVNLTNPGGTEISQLCPSQINNSQCNGGTLPGMLVFRFTATVTLSPCDTIKFNYSKCCRSASIINLKTPDSYGIYVDALLNSVIAPCNNSPVFTAQPIPYVCVGQPVSYNFGIDEPDGDSLHYSFVNAATAGPTNLAYVSGYSATLPIPGIVLDIVAGQLTFTPTMIGSFVVVVKVKEYDSNGNFIGSTMRDIQFIVLNCANSVPDPASGVISNASKAVTPTGPYSAEVCENSPFTFKATYTDQNAEQVLTLLSNITTQLPGSVLTTTGLNPLIASISWTPPTGSINKDYTFNVKVSDGSCPSAVEQFFVYNLTIVPPCSMIFIPNVFTPGGANPVFLINNYGLVNYSIQIVDRWGTKVFESNDANDHWDGNNVSDGTYYFMIKAKGVDEKEYNEKGFVQRIEIK
ncbi:MAG: gliding motility-associated C-terminal domain-containing protein [Bacteroidota bacterium]